MYKHGVPFGILLLRLLHLLLPSLLLLLLQLSCKLLLLLLVLLPFGLHGCLPKVWVVHRQPRGIARLLLLLLLIDPSMLLLCCLMSCRPA